MPVAVLNVFCGRLDPVTAQTTALARPYRVHVDVLTFSGSYWAPKAAFTLWADLALTADQADTLTGGADRAKVLKALNFPQRSVLLWWAAATAAFIAAGFIPAVGYAVPAAAWSIGTGVLALILGRRWRFLGRVRQRIECTLDAAVAAGAAHRVNLHDKEWSRLHRIEAALSILQAHIGTGFDDRARSAVAAVLNPPPAVPRKPDTGTKGSSPKARYRAAMHGIFRELLEPTPPPAVDPVTALEAEAARCRSG